MQRKFQKGSGEYSEACNLMIPNFNEFATCAEQNLKFKFVILNLLDEPEYIHMHIDFNYLQNSNNVNIIN